MATSLSLSLSLSPPPGERQTVGRRGGLHPSVPGPVGRQLQAQPGAPPAGHGSAAAWPSLPPPAALCLAPLPPHRPAVPSWGQGGERDRLVFKCGERGREMDREASSLPISSSSSSSFSKHHSISLATLGPGRSRLGAEEVLTKSTSTGFPCNPSPSSLAPAVKTGGAGIPSD